MKNELRIACYCRVSTLDQAKEGYSIEAQKNNCVEFINKNNFIVDGSILFYVDEGKSGGNIDRKGLKDLMRDVIANKLDMIVIFTLDRLSRNVMISHHLMSLFLKHNVKLKSVKDNVSTKTANSRFIVGILSEISQWERENDRDRTVTALHQMAKEGKFPIGYTPLGYVKKDKALVINKKTKYIVEYLFSLACEGIPISSMPKKLNDKYNISMNEYSIAKIIKKKLYYGYFEFQGELYLNVVPPIISKDTYDFAQECLNKRCKNEKKTFFIFQNKVRCSCCNNICSKETTQKPDRTYYYYYCPNCNKRINQSKIEEYIITNLVALINLNTHRKHKSKYSKELRNIDKKLNNCYEDYLSKKINDSVFYYTMAALHESKRKVEEKLSITKENKNSVVWWKTLSIDVKKDYIDEYIKYIIINTSINEIMLIQYK